MLYMYFTRREIETLQVYARGQRHLADNRADGDVEFWDGLLTKIDQLHKTPACCWCDSHSWDNEDATTRDEPVCLAPQGTFNQP